jgi:tRNA G18 (ribose-2'-O)-methylase SpoU
MKRNPFVIILNDIRSTLNVGAILRTADAVLAQKVYLCGITATPEHPKVAKTSLGAENEVPWEYKKDATELIDKLKKEGFQIVGLELHQRAESFWDANFQLPVALVVGNEVEGINDEILQKCDLLIQIPMLGTKESLNVATSTGIASYEIIKRIIN